MMNMATAFMLIFRAEQYGPLERPGNSCTKHLSVVYCAAAGFQSAENISVGDTNSTRPASHGLALFAAVSVGVFPWSNTQSLGIIVHLWYIILYCIIGFKGLGV